MGVSILAAAAAPTLATEVDRHVRHGRVGLRVHRVANTTIQLTAAPEMRGRVMALYAIAFLGSTPIGGPIVGWISQQFGPRDRLRARRHRGPPRDCAWAAWSLLRHRASRACTDPR